MSSRLILFIFIQSMLLCAAAIFSRSPTQASSMATLGTVLASQFCLIGIWFGVGDGTIGQRTMLSGLLAVGLSLAAISVPAFNTWELLMYWVRLALLGGVYCWLRERKNLMFRLCDEKSDIVIFHIGLKHLFALTFGFAFVLTMMRFLSDSSPPGYEILLVIMVMALGMSGALAPLAASAAAFSKLDVLTALIAVFTVSQCAGAMGFFVYVGTDSIASAVIAFCTSLGEASLVTLSILALRAAGYRLAAG